MHRLLHIQERFHPLQMGDMIKCPYNLGCSFSVTSSIASLFTSNWHFSAELESFFWHSSHTRVISQNLSNQISILTKVGFHSNHQIPNHDLNSALWHLYDCKQRGDDSAYRKAAGQLLCLSTRALPVNLLALLRPPFSDWLASKHIRAYHPKHEIVNLHQLTKLISICG